MQFVEFTARISPTNGLLERVVFSSALKSARWVWDGTLSVCVRRGWPASGAVLH